MPVKQESQVFTRPRLGFVDVALLLVRALPLMLLIFMPLAGLGIWGASQLEKEYTAQSRVMVSLSEEYVFRPRVGEGVQNSAPELDALTATEIDLMQSPVVLERVIEQIGFQRLYPKAAKAFAEASADLKYEKSQAGLVELQENFSAYAAPKQAVILARFKHPDPALSADVLNAILDTYLDYRAEIFEDKSPASLSVQRLQFETDLAEADERIRQFLIANGLSDFATERSTLQTLFANIEEALFTNGARHSELDGQQVLLRQQLLRTEAQIDEYVEDTTAQTLVDLELEREELLTRYTPDSQAMRDINQRIARARQYIGSEGRPRGTVRRGPNPLYQSIETRLSDVSAQAASLRLQRQELERQAAEIKSRQRKLSKLEPRWQELLRNRDLLESNARSFAAREIEARSLAEIARAGSDNIRVLERARRPAKGSSMKLLGAIAAVLFAGFCALMAGLGYALTRKGFATPGSLERTVGLPVVSTVKRYK